MRSKRRSVDRATIEKELREELQTLVENELKRAGHTGSTTTQCVGDARTNEPWVRHIDRDLVGLALSGGGVRSATFNLGWMQALAKKGVLERVDYLSTVSGGGYIGGFWTAWRARPESKTEVNVFPGISRMFPETSAPTPSVASGASTPASQVLASPGSGAHADVDAVRHLREFSRFIAPRTGLVNIDAWYALMAVVGGAVFTLTAAFAFLLLVVTLAVLAAWSIAHWGSLAFGTIVALGLFFVERFRPYGIVDTSPRQEQLFRGFLGVVIAPAIGFFSVAYSLRKLAPYFGWPASVSSASYTLYDLAKAPPTPNHLAVPAALVATFLAGLLVRLVFSRIDVRNHYAYEAQRALERTLARLLAFAIASIVALALWYASQYPVSLAVSIWGALGGGSAVAAARELLAAATKPPAKEESAPVAMARRNAPSIVGGIAVFAACLGASHLVFWVTSQRWTSELTGFVLAAPFLWIVATMLLFDPHRMGPHAYYRSRLARAYLGASRTDAEKNRSSSEHVRDDPGFPTGRPVHLVCCAANDLRADPVSTLERGASSAVFNGLGLYVQGMFHPASELPRYVRMTGSEDELRLSPALTASGAAVDPAMGSVSIDLGWSVGFVLAALNLRLGLWLPRRSCRTLWSSVFPGVALFREMLGMIDLDSPEIHLSDGGHFENLGLYELVRRHCRYILVSDAAADGDSAFDDLANAIRRIREDFRVEIELDVSSLRPNEQGLCAEPVAIGTIHYDGLDGYDKGTIVYIRPTLVGTEPTDVAQYRKRNPSFPHESTGDQFFDDAQWESYRRLGEHRGHEVFAFLETLSPEKLKKVEPIFSRAIRRWSNGASSASAAVASIVDTRVAGASSRFGSAEVLFGAGAPAGIIDAIDRAVERVVPLEEAYRRCDLERAWSLPTNQGVMSYLHGVFSDAAVRDYWPFVAPVFSDRFVTFVKHRFLLRTHTRREKTCREDLPTLSLRIAVPSAVADAPGYATREWLRLRGCVDDARFTTQYALHLVAPSTIGERWPTVEVAVLHARADGDPFAPTRLRWSSRDLFVPPALLGAGFQGELFEQVLAALDEAGCAEIVVTMESGPRTAAELESDHDTPTESRSGAETEPESEAGARIGTQSGPRPKPDSEMPRPHAKCAQPSGDPREPGERRARAMLVDFYKSEQFWLQDRARKSDPVTMIRRTEKAKEVTRAWD